MKKHQLHKPEFTAAARETRTGPSISGCTANARTVRPGSRFGSHAITCSGYALQVGAQLVSPLALVFCSTESRMPLLPLTSLDLLPPSSRLSSHVFKHEFFTTTTLHVPTRC